MRETFAAVVPAAVLIAACGSNGRNAGDTSVDQPGDEADAAGDVLPDTAEDDAAATDPDAIEDTTLDTAGDPDADAAEDAPADAPADGDTAPPAFAGARDAFPCDGRVVLKWAAATDPSMPISYRVYVREDAGTFDWDMAAAETSGLEASITGLANGTTYHFAVRAVDAEGNEDANAVEVTATPLIAYPVLPHHELVFEVDPVTLPSCHSSCIVELPGGELIVSWYCGTGEHTTDVAIWGSRREVGATSWTAPEWIQETPGIPDGNAVLYVGEGGKLWLFWALQVEFEWPSAIVHVKTSNDLGHTWTPDWELGTGGGYLPRTHPKTLDNGWIVLPLYVEYTASSVLVRSEDGGLSWEAPSTILSFLGTQPTVIQRSDGSLFAMMRSGSPPQKSWKAVSTDRGVTWGDQMLSPLDNPGSSLEMVMLDSGTVLVAFNDSTDSRTNLSVGISHDEGATWPTVRVVEEDPALGFDYPSIIQDECGLVHLTYSWASRQSIAHFVLDESWVEGG